MIRRPRRRRLWPERDYYADFHRAPEEENPIEFLIDEGPGVRAQQKRCRALTRAFERSLGERGPYIAMSDARSTLEAKRENAAFNIGVEVGIVAGRAARIAGDSGPIDAGEQQFMRAARGLILDGSIPVTRRLRVLLELSYALASDAPPRGEMLSTLSDPAAAGRRRSASTQRSRTSSGRLRRSRHGRPASGKH